ncbi:MAG: hypothetical protein E6471_02730, partial [Bradyrhizobium sp.]|nr:hypothetical protein [Bradyrhizobium sp.]
LGSRHFSIISEVRFALGDNNAQVSQRVDHWLFNNHWMWTHCKRVVRPEFARPDEHVWRHHAVGDGSSDSN